MPPRKQPLTLKVAALRAVTGDLTYQVRVVMSTSAQPHEARLGLLAEVLSAVPEAVRSDVVAAALRCADAFLGYRNNHPARRVLDKLLAALLPHRTTRRLALPVAESFQLREALLRRVQDLTQLRELTLSESLHVHTSVDAVVQALPALSLLTVLRAPWLCSDAMLLAVAKHCPRLEVLDASESARVTDRAAAALAASCPALRVALLTGSRVTERGYRELLAKLPLLQRVGLLQGLGAVLRAVGAPVALVDWDSDLPPEPAEASLCPRVKAVTLSDVWLVSAPEVPVAGGALMEAALPAGVERLRVCRNAGLRDHAAGVRLQLGAALTHVDLMEHPVTLALVVELGRECPDLRVLKLATDSEHAVLPAHPARDAPFRRLEELHLYLNAGPVFEYVLLHARALRRVSVSSCPHLVPKADLSDATLRRVLDANPLSELVSLSVCCACALTMASVYALLTGCPRLRALHDLAEWDVSEQQRAELRELAAANNWDLELGPVAAPVPGPALA